MARHGHKRSKVKKGDVKTIKKMFLIGNLRKENVMKNCLKTGQLKMLVALVLIPGFCLVSIAQETGKATGQEKVLTNVGEKMLKKISVDFRDTPIDDVIMTIGKQVDLDIVKGPDVTGSVTATLTDVPLEEALNHILTAYGAGFVASENMIRIVPSSQLTTETEKLVSKVYRIYYADVTQVEQALAKIVSKRGSLTVSKGSSNIIVTDTESNIKNIDAFLEEIDRVTPQILVEVRIYDISNKENFDIGVDWYAGSNTPITDIERTKTDSRTNTQTNTSNTTSDNTTTHTTTDIGETGPTSTTDNERIQIYDNLVDPLNPTSDNTTNTITTTSGTAGRTADTTTTTATEGTNSTTELTNSVTSDDSETRTLDGTWLRDSYSKSKPFMGGGFNTEDGGTLRFGILNDHFDIELALSILHKQVGAKLLANPRIMVLDNETASFKSIREIPYQRLQQGGYQSFGTTEFKEVGVQLEVTPHLAKDDMIRMHIVPVFSVHVDDVILSLAGASTMPQPVVDKREADTITLVKDGQTVVIGGLRKKETTHDIRKIPLLGDLPVLGNLFRSDSEEVVNSELVVFITPRIVEQSFLTETEAKYLEATEIQSPKLPTTKIDPETKKL
jgi:type II secretory pathway component GspD/PulD (secretin)